MKSEMMIGEVYHVWDKIGDLANRMNSMDGRFYGIMKEADANELQAKWTKIRKMMEELRDEALTKTGYTEDDMYDYDDKV